MSNIPGNPKIFNRGVNLAGSGSGFGIQQKETGTDSSQAITLNTYKGQITSSTTNLSAKTTEAITLTDKYITADSVVLCQVQGGGAGDPVISKVVPSAGSCSITTLNADPSNACDAAYKVDFIVIN